MQASLRGRYFEEVVQAHGLASYADRLDSMSSLSGAALENEVKKLVRELRKESDSAKKDQPTKLSDYSPWLASMSFAGENVDMFGQYVGFGKPDSGTLVKIVSFDPSVSPQRQECLIFMPDQM